MDECVDKEGAMNQFMEDNKFCHFTAEVRAIVNDTAMDLTACPDDDSLVLKINGKPTQMKMREANGVKVNATENFKNIVSVKQYLLNTSQVRIQLFPSHPIMIHGTLFIILCIGLLCQVAHVRCSY